MAIYDDNNLRDTLEYLYDKYNREEFIEHDPISIPHKFDRQEDIEISGFLAAAIAWGNRKAIVKSANKMLKYLDNKPYDFVLNASDAEIKNLYSFVHRTFNGRDFADFIKSLRHFYLKYGSLGNFFEENYLQSNDMRIVLSKFRTEFMCVEHNDHCDKHISSIDKASACKRLNMYLRWMVRRDDRGVDFGLWKRIPMSSLYIPLDVHSGNTGRELGLLQRTQNDWKAVEELTGSLRKFDASDPVRFDFALFGVGVDKGRGIV